MGLRAIQISVSLIFMVIVATCDRFALSTSSPTKVKISSIAESGTSGRKEMVERIEHVYADSNTQHSDSQVETTFRVNDPVIVTSVLCGKHARIMLTVASFFSSMLTFTDYEHYYRFILFTDNVPFFQDTLQGVLKNFSRNEPRLEEIISVNVLPVGAFDQEDTLTKRMMNLFRPCAGFRITPGFVDSLINLGHPIVIYMDVDMIITDNLAELWEFRNEMSGNLLMMSPDDFGRGRGFYFNAIIHGKYNYSTENLFGPYGSNSGLMLMDLQAIKKSNLPSLAADIERFRQYPLKLGDQCILNVACAREEYSQIRCGFLPCRWNLQPGFLPYCLSEQKRGPGALHGCGGKFVIPRTVSEDGIVVTEPAHESFGAYYYGTFPCYDRIHCFLRLAKQAKFFADQQGCGKLTDAFLPNNEFNGSEFEFSRRPLSKFSGSFHCRLYQNTLRIAHRFKQQLERVGSSTQIEKWPRELT